MNLPPNCTNADIDRAFGQVTTCQECLCVRMEDGHATCRDCARSELLIDTPPEPANLPAQ